MATNKNAGSAKRFGPRYGKTTKNRLGIIEKEQKKNHKCPYCSYEMVKQQSVGIFLCKKCGAKFASKAYTIAKIAPIKTKVELE